MLYRRLSSELTFKKFLQSTCILSHTHAHTHTHTHIHTYTRHTHTTPIAMTRILKNSLFLSRTHTRTLHIHTHTHTDYFDYFACGPWGQGAHCVAMYFGSLFADCDWLVYCCGLENASWFCARTEVDRETRTEEKRARKGGGRGREKEGCMYVRAYMYIYFLPA